MQNILIVEDDPIIGAEIEAFLNEADYAAKWVRSYRAAHDLPKEVYDLAILDLNLPDGDGMALLSYLSATGAKVIIATVKDDPGFIASALDRGADDYITTPFDLRVLRARIDVRLRESEVGEREIRTHRDCRYDSTRGTIEYRGKVADLTALEFRILSYFICNPNRIFTREQLLARFWDERENYVNDNTLTATIKRIRDKTEKDVITTVRGIGYRME